MTLVKDTLDAWLETGLEYMRDQLRTNSTVGLGGSLGMAMVEIGDFTFADLAVHPELSPSIWIVPKTTTPTQYGNTLEHTIRMEVRVFGVTALSPVGSFVDEQQAFRRIVGKVWNEALHLRDTGITAGAWHDLSPDGAVEFASADTEAQALRSGIIRLRWTQARIWMSGGS